MSWRDWTPAKADKIKVGDRVVILDGEAPDPGEAYGTVVRWGDEYLSTIVETPDGWTEPNIGNGRYWYVPEQGLRRLKTKEDLLAAMAKYGACDNATEFVRKHPSTDAETIGRDALKTHPEWVDWVNDHALSKDSALLYNNRLREADGGCMPWRFDLERTEVKAVIWQCYREWCRS